MGKGDGRISARPDQVGLISDTPIRYEPLTNADVRASWLTFEQTAKRLGVSKWALRQMVDTGEIGAPVFADGRERFPEFVVRRALYDLKHGDVAA